MKRTWLIRLNKGYLKNSDVKFLAQKHQQRWWTKQLWSFFAPWLAIWKKISWWIVSDLKKTTNLDDLAGTTYQSMHQNNVCALNDPLLDLWVSICPCIRIICQVCIKWPFWRRPHKSGLFIRSMGALSEAKTFVEQKASEAASSKGGFISPVVNRQNWGKCMIMTTGSNLWVWLYRP